MPERVALAVELTPAQVRPIAYRIISKKYGINLKSSALQVLADHLGHKFGSEWRGAKSERFLDEIARLWKDEDKGLFLEGEPLKKVINDLENIGASQQNPAVRTQTMAGASVAGESRRRFHWRDYFKVVNANRQRWFQYNSVHHRFDLGASEYGADLGAAKSHIHMFPSRWHILYDRIQRTDVFNGTERLLTPIKNMIGRKSKHFFIFGVLSRKEGTGAMWLIDTSGSIELVFLDDTEVMPDHYYCEGSFAICEGELMNGKFVVVTMGPPLPELRSKSRDVFGNVDFMQLTSLSRSTIERIDYNFLQVLEAEEQKSTHHRIMILGSDLHLDKVSHLDGLRQVLAKFELAPPIALVLVGSFSSVPLQASDSIAKYTEVMASLALLLKEFPRICRETKLVLVPGENDPWHSCDSQGPAPWPLKPLPALFTRRLPLAASDVVFASNPARICYLSQEIVVCSDHYGDRFREHSLTFGDASPMQVDSQASTTGQDVASTHTAQDTLADTLADMDLDTQEADRQYALNEMTASSSIPVPQPTWDYNSQNEQARKLVSTILDQAHLSPFTVDARPIIWEYEHALSLAQWPDVLITVDPTSPRFAIDYQGCQCLNPGRFLRAGSVQWLEYNPCTRAGVLMSERV